MKFFRRPKTKSAQTPAERPTKHKNETVSLPVQSRYLYEFYLTRT